MVPISGAIGNVVLLRRRHYVWFTARSACAFHFARTVMNIIRSCMRDGLTWARFLCVWADARPRLIRLTSAAFWVDHGKRVNGPCRDPRQHVGWWYKSRADLQRAACESARQRGDSVKFHKEVEHYSSVELNPKLPGAERYPPTPQSGSGWIFLPPPPPNWFWRFCLESKVLLLVETMLFILEMKGGLSKSSPATTHPRSHSSPQESSKIPPRAAWEGTCDAGNVCERGHRRPQKAITETVKSFSADGYLQTWPFYSFKVERSWIICWQRRRRLLVYKESPTTETLCNYESESY